METSLLSRQYLETASTADLLALADDYGLDIPNNLNRRFIIGELLEVAEELEENLDDEPIQEAETPEYTELPRTYNETQICAILRTPIWLFVYWDISESEQAMLTSDIDFNGFFLHAAFFNTKDDEKPSDSFDIKIGVDDREQYVLIPSNKKFCEISLNCDRGPLNLKFMASTRRIAIPQETPEMQNMQPGKQFNTNEQIKLSGIEYLFRDQYMNKKEIFS